MIDSNLIGVVLGDINIDAYGRFPDIPEKGDDLIAEEINYGLGGACINLSRLIANLNVTVYPVGNIGDDELGDLALQKINSDSLKTSCIDCVSGNTGFMFCLVTPDGERTMLGYRGVNEKKIDYKKRIKKIAKSESLDFILVSSYIFTSKQKQNNFIKWLESSKDEAKSSLKAVVTSDLFIKEVNRGNIDITILNFSDIVFMNKSEFNQLIGKLTRKHVKETANDLKLDQLVVTVGEKGCWVYDRKKETLNKVPGFEVRTLDTTGAGDSFASAFLWGKLNDISSRKSAILGNFFGALASLYYGTNDLTKLLDNHIRKGAFFSNNISYSLLQKDISKIVNKK